MFDRLVVWDINSLIKVGCFTPQVIPSGIVNRGIQRTGYKKKDPDRGRKHIRKKNQRVESEHQYKKKDPDRGRKQAKTPEEFFDSYIYKKKDPDRGRKLS